MVQAEEETEEKLAKQPLKNGDRYLQSNSHFTAEYRISSYDNGGIFFKKSKKNVLEVFQD